MYPGLISAFSGDAFTDLTDYKMRLLGVKLILKFNFTTIKKEFDSEEISRKRGVGSRIEWNKIERKCVSCWLSRDERRVDKIGDKMRDESIVYTVEAVYHAVKFCSLSERFLLLKLMAASKLSRKLPRFVMVDPV